MKFCDKLLMLRQRNGMTQEEFAAALGVSRQTVSKWELDASYPDLEKVQLICNLFRIRIDDLLNAEKELPQESAGEPMALCPDSLGANIRKYRTLKGIPQEVFAELLDVSRQSVSKWENGVAMPKTELLIAMLSYLEVDLGALFESAPSALNADAAEPILPKPAVEERIEIAERVKSTERIDVAEEIAPLDEALEGGADLPSHPKQKRSRKWMKWVFIPLASLLSAALAFAAVLFFPHWFGDPIGNTAKALFSDQTTALAQCEELWSREGVALTLKTDTSEITFTLRANEESIALGGLTNDGKEILLPRGNVRHAMEQCPLHPYYYADYSLTMEEFDALVESIEELDRLIGNSDDRAMSETLEKIFEELDRQVKPKTSWEFAKGDFGLAKTMTWRINQRKMISLLEAIIPIVEQDKMLNETFSISLDDVAVSGAADATTLSAQLTSLKEMIREQSSDLSFIFSTTVQGGRISHIWASVRITDPDGVITDLDLVVDLSYRKNTVEADVVFGVGAKDGNSLQNSSYVELLLGIQKTENDQTVQLSLGMEQKVTTELNGQKSEESEQLTDLNFQYDKTTNAYTLTITPANGEQTVMGGTLIVRGEEGELTFSLNRHDFGGKALLDGDFYEISLKAMKNATAFPTKEDAAIYEMDRHEMLEWIKSIRAKAISDAITDWTGQKPDWKMTEDGKLLIVGDALKEWAEEVADAAVYYREYHAAASQITANKLFVRHEKSGMYVIISLAPASNVYNVRYAYDLTEEILSTHHEITYENGKVQIHTDTVEISRVEPTCSTEGSVTYQCERCQKTYTVTLSSNGHDYDFSAKLEAAPNLLGEMREATVTRCKDCGHITSYSSEGVTIRLSAEGDGMTLVVYTPVEGKTEYNYFTIPDAHAEAMNIKKIRLSNSLPVLGIHIPNGVESIAMGSFTKTALVELIVLPESLQKISNDAFGIFGSLHTVFYEGTESQWALIDLGIYRGDFEFRNLVFSSSEEDLGGLPDLLLAYGKAKQEADRHKSIATDVDYVDNFVATSEIASRFEGLEVGAKVYWVDYDEPKDRIVICSHYLGKTGITCYDGTTYELISSFTTTRSCTGVHNAWDGYLATADGANSFSLYDTKTGQAVRTDIWLPESVGQIYIMDGRVYVGNTVNGVFSISVFDIETKLLVVENLVEQCDFRNDTMYVNRELHRLVILGELYNTLYDFGIIDTKTMEIVMNSNTPSKADPSLIELGYVKIYYDRKPHYYSIKDYRWYGEEEITMPVDRPKLADNEYMMETIICRSDLLMCLIYNDEGKFYLAVRTAEAEWRMVYYAQSAILLQNGSVLLYTKDGYGMVILGEKES